MKPILEVQNISKKYRIQHLAGGYLSLRERMQKFYRFEKSRAEDFWALNDVTFEVQPGESVGIIGRNGAGKSTLLKILSKITPPTNGKIITRGRIASLLEVGTGFHPELTGRENIFFNGSLLGMKRKEIEGKFDEIVDFSGVERFLDTPLKHFSNGMQLRLAFAVAAFLENEILIIDEVLAVGDAEFQKKCLGKMGEVSNDGRTVLFVSHNLDAVEALCKRAIHLSGGSIVAKGTSKEILSSYLEGVRPAISFKSIKLSAGMKLTEFTFDKRSILSGDTLGFRIAIENSCDTNESLSDFSILFYNYKQQRVAIYDLRKYISKNNCLDSQILFNGEIINFNLIDGVYSVGIYCGIGENREDHLNLTAIEVKMKYQGLDFKPYDAQYRGFVEFN